MKKLRLCFLISMVAILLYSCETKKSTAKKANSQVSANLSPHNEYLADGVYPIPHGEPAQQDATGISGPLDSTRVLAQNDLTYVHTGPASIGAYTSSKYPDGKRVLWLSTINGIFKIDNDSYKIVDQIPSDKSEIYTEEYTNKYIDGFNKDNSLNNLPLAIEASKILADVSGVYTVVDKDNYFYVAGKEGTITKYGDTEKNNAASKIEVKDVFTIPKEISGPTLGMNMTYDGWIILPTENGYLVAVSRDFKQFQSIRLNHADEENTGTQGVGYGWVRNTGCL